MTMQPRHAFFSVSLVCLLGIVACGDGGKPDVTMGTKDASMDAGLVDSGRPRRDAAACPAINCGLACPAGFAIDDRGCTTCQCKPTTAGACPTVTDAALCTARADCRWLVPGCGDPALAAASCFDRTAVGCTATSCPAGKSCVNRVINPCAPTPSSSNRFAAPVTCAACGQQIALCL